MKTILDLSKEELHRIVFHMTQAIFSISAVIARDIENGKNNKYNLKELTDFYIILNPLFKFDETTTLYKVKLENLLLGLVNPEHKDSLKDILKECDCEACTYKFDEVINMYKDLITGRKEMYEDDKSRRTGL